MQNKNKKPSTSERMELQLNLDKTNNTPFFRVRVFSQKRAGAISFGDVPFNEDRLQYRIQLMAASLAEKQNKEFKDKHDPDMFARQALECLEEMIEHINQHRAKPVDQTERLVQEGGAV